MRVFIVLTPLARHRIFAATLCASEGGNVNNVRTPRFQQCPAQFGSYRILRHIGQGGMGEVYEAQRLPLGASDTRVALKVPHNPCRPRTLESLEDEWTIGRRCHHPNIVRMHEWGCVEGVPFIVMELVSGENVQRLLRQAMMRVSAEAAIALALQVCDALEHLHGMCNEDGEPLHAVYQDLKPGNLLLDRDGHVTLVDLGLTQFQDSLVVMEPGIVRGTPSYTTPEQVQGVTLDRRVNVFLMGSLLYELVTHRLAFNEPSVSETIAAVEGCMEPVARAQRQQRVEAVCPDLWKIVDACHQARPQDRPRDMRAVRTLLQTVRRRIGSTDPHAALRAWVTFVMEDMFSEAENDDDESAA